jgi:hypothetical protein
MSTWTNIDRLTAAEKAPIMRYREALGGLVWHMRELRDLLLHVLLGHQTLRTECILVIFREAKEHVRVLQAAMRPASAFYHDLGGFVKMDCVGFASSPDADLMAQAKHALEFLHGRLSEWYLLEGRPQEVVHTTGRKGWRGFKQYTEGSYWEGYMRSYDGLMGAAGGGVDGGGGA